MQHLPYRNDPEKGKIVIDFMRHIQSRERGDCTAPPHAALSRQQPGSQDVSSVDPDWC